MITITDIPKKFHWLGNKNNFIAQCQNKHNVGQYATYQYIINSAVPVGSIIKIDVDGRSLFFKQRKARSNDFYNFVSVTDFCDKLFDCYYLSEFLFTIEVRSSDFVIHVQAKERGKHSFSISYMGTGVAKIANRFEIKSSALTAVKDASFITCTYSFDGADVGFLPNYAVGAWWETETTRTPMFFLNPDERGVVSVGSAVVRSLITTPHLPTLDANLVPQRILAATKYRLVLAELYGETPTINKVDRLEWRYGFDGTASEHRSVADLPSWEDANMNTPINNERNIVRVIGRDNMKQISVLKSKPEYIYILVANASLSDDDFVNVSIKSFSTFTNGSTSEIVETHKLKNNSVYVVNINAYNDGVAYRSVAVKTSVACFETTIVIKPDFENQYLFLLKNNFGIFSCFASDGIAVKKTAEIEKFSYDNTNVFSASNPAETLSASFVLHKAEAETLNSFSFESAYMAVNGRWVKIFINSDSIEVLNSEDDITELSLNFSLAEDIDRREFEKLNAVDKNSIVDFETIVKL